MKWAATRAALVEGAGRRHGLSLVEVLVALAIMASVTLALFGLQAAGLRAARTAVITRQQAAALRYEASLARVVTAPAIACRGAQLAGDCSLATTCLAAVAPPADCELWQTVVELIGPDGRSTTLTTVAYAPLETAPVGVFMAAPPEPPAAGSAGAVAP